MICDSIHAATLGCFGCGDRVSVDNVQEKVSRVVVRFAEIA